MTLLFSFILLQLSVEGSGMRIKSLMYENIDSTAGCYRRLNGTHQIGCSSKYGGSTGIIHVCKTREDLTFILENGKGKHYIPILPATLFDIEILNEMIMSQKVSGLMLFLHNVTLESLGHFTHDYQCPNPYTSLNRSCRRNSEWNQFGTGLLHADIPFPVFYTDNEKEILKMNHCFEQFNNFSYERQGERSLCSLEMKAFMFATTNTVTCQRRSHIVTNLQSIKFCDPLGDKNLWVSLYPLVNGPNENEPTPIVDNQYIVISAKLDTTSMFEPLPGGNSPVTGIVTLLTVAKYLKTAITTDILRKAKMNILFILFNGESYDYIGSQRILYDMLKGDFPMKKEKGAFPQIHPDNISLFIELSQLGNSRESNLYVHYLNERNEIGSFYKKLLKNGRPHIHFQNVPGTNGLPPASLHTFLKNNPAFPGLIIADHESSYSNHFYNSMFDNSTNIAFKLYDAQHMPMDSIQQFIANISEAIGKSVFEEITGEEYAGVASGDAVLVNELLYCYLENPNCRVYKATHRDTVLSDRPLSLYVGVNSVPNFVTTFTSLALGWITGDIVGKSNGSCINSPKNHAFKYYNMSESMYSLDSTECFRLSIHATEAVSPAFIIPGYDWSSGKFSTWSESRWYDMSVRLFLKPSAVHEQMTMVLGCLSVIFSFSLVYFVNSKSRMLFSPVLSAEFVVNC